VSEEEERFVCRVNIIFIVIKITLVFIVFLISLNGKIQ